MTKLLEIINNSVAIIYERRDVHPSERTEPSFSANAPCSNPKNGQFVQWKVLLSIKKLPGRLIKNGLNIFSPNLAYMLSVVFDETGSQFLINKIIDNTIVPFCRIPNDILDASDHMEDRHIKSRLKFLTDDMIRIQDN